MKTLQGIAASRGIGIGPAFHFRRADLRFDRCTVEDPAAEWTRCQGALGAEQGAVITLCAEGEDADQALEALTALVNDNFGEGG